MTVEELIKAFDNIADTNKLCGICKECPIETKRRCRKETESLLMRKLYLDRKAEKYDSKW